MVPDPAQVAPMGEQWRRGLEGWWMSRGGRQTGGSTWEAWWWPNPGSGGAEDADSGSGGQIPSESWPEAGARGGHGSTAMRGERDGEREGGDRLSPTRSTWSSETCCFRILLCTKAVTSLSQFLFPQQSKKGSCFTRPIGLGVGLVTCRKRCVYIPILETHTHSI